jgi:hypothetical protein
MGHTPTQIHVQSLQSCQFFHSRAVRSHLVRLQGGRFPYGAILLPCGRLRRRMRRSSP